ncbi:MAG: hypothetical protein CMJ18_22450 [Phycisphaeraceae bacterium]|nr:hypothetical protein [Phycisphaeraceae bacterium]
MPTLDANSLRTLACDVYRAAGTPEPIARIVSAYQVDTNLYGHDSHGCVSIPRFVRDIETGKIVPDAEPDVVRNDGPTALLNGNRSFGQYSASLAVRRAIDAGRRFGLGAVGITNCNHVGALWGYMKSVVDEHMVGIIACSAGPRGGSMVPFGGMKPVLAGNPIGFGVPGGSRPPMITDMSTAVAAGGKVLMALQSGEKIPDHWVLDAEGRPTTDPASFMTQDLQIIGAMRPFGGHKGYALAILAEVLGAVLTGYGAAYKDDYIEGNGTFVITIDVARFTDVETFRDEVDRFFAAIKSVPCDDKTDEILIPGEMEMRSFEQRCREGIPIPDGTWQTIVEAAESVGVKAAV